MRHQSINDSFTAARTTATWGSLPGLVLAALALLLAAGPAGSATGNTLHRGTANELRSLDPQVVIGNTAGALMYELFEGLMTVDPYGKLAPGLAESWKRSDDGLRYTFKLRKGLRWSDGTPLTTADFVYSWRRIINPKNALRGAGTLFPIKNAVAISRGKAPPESLGVRAVDPLVLEVTLEAPAPYFVDMLAGFPAVPVPRHVIEKYGAQWTMPGRIVSNGAYVLDKWVTNTYYRLVRNKNFRDAASVRIDEVFYYPVPDKDTAEKRFRAGELDIVLNASPSRLPWLRENLKDELKITSSLGIRYLILNTRRPALKDPRVRKALSIAIDREAIADKILKDGSDPAYTIVPAALPGYGKNAMAYSAQPVAVRITEAKRLLAAAGYGPGKPLQFTLDFQNAEEARRVAVALQAMWRKIGVDAQLSTVGFQGKVKDLLGGNFDASWFTYYVPYSDATAFLNLLGTGNSRNYSAYSNPQFDRLIDEANRSADPAARIGLLKKAEQLALADHPVIPLFTPARIYLISKRVKGWNDHIETHPARYLWLENSPR